MKRINYLLLVTLLLVCTIIFVGCGSKKEVVSIEANDGSEISIDEFDFDTADFTITYADGSKETVKGSDIKISEDDLVKLIDAGIHEVTLTYNETSYTTKIAIRDSEDNIVLPTGACYVYSDSHYINGKQYSSIYVGGNDSTAFLAFEFKLKYDKETVKDIKIIPASDYAELVQINDNGERISVNFCDSNAGPLNTEIFRIEYTSTNLYKNFTLDTESDYGFYKYANKDIHLLNCTFNFNW